MTLKLYSALCMHILQFEIAADLAEGGNLLSNSLIFNCMKCVVVKVFFCVILFRPICSLWSVSLNFAVSRTAL